jgi:protein-disulfide isomerase
VITDGLRRPIAVTGLVALALGAVALNHTTVRAQAPPPSSVELQKQVADLEAERDRVVERLTELEGRIKALEGDAGPRTALPKPSSPVSLVGLPILGSSEAKLVILEFGDFQCPYCRSFAATTLPLLRRAYIEPGRASYAFINVPLTAIHPGAQAAAEAAVCAFRGGKFWDYHDALLRADNFGREGLADLAATLNLKKPTFQRCLTGEAAPEVSRQADLARRLGINSTPAFFIGRPVGKTDILVTRTIKGAQPSSTFRRAIDEELSGTRESGRR